jgi:hypothetical protein
MMSFIAKVLVTFITLVIVAKGSLATDIGRLTNRLGDIEALLMFHLQKQNNSNASVNAVRELSKDWKFFGTNENQISYFVIPESIEIINRDKSMNSADTWFNLITYSETTRKSYNKSADYQFSAWSVVINCPLSGNSLRVARFTPFYIDFFRRGGERVDETQAAMAGVEIEKFPFGRSVAQYVCSRNK